jgi:predicted ATPase with chaperone activity
MPTLAPADLRKSGASFDLAIAIALHVENVRLPLFTKAQLHESTL